MKRQRSIQTFLAGPKRQKTTTATSSSIKIMSWNVASYKACAGKGFQKASSSPNITSNSIFYLGSREARSNRVLSPGNKD